MNITEIVETAGWKNFMAKLYGMGATVVIIGALFKINHWPGGVYFITAGMGVEAVIFFFSSFEPLHEELDWTLVYPELAGMSDPDELENFSAAALATEGRQIESFDGAMQRTPQTVPGQAAHMGGGIAVGAQQLAVAGETTAALTEAMKAFDPSKLPDFEKAGTVTTEYITNLEKASSSVYGLHDTYVNTSETIKESATNLTNSYYKAADVIVKSGEEVAKTYHEVAQTISSGNLSIVEGGKEYQNQLNKLNQNLQTLNVVYEEQIKDSSERMKGSSEIFKGLQDMMVNLRASVDETNQYKQEMSRLKESISSLNGIYGNMLDSLSTTVKQQQKS